MSVEETHNFKYDPYTEFVTLSADLIFDSSVVDNIEQEFPVPQLDRRIAISHATEGTARVPYAIQNYSRGETFIISSADCSADDGTNITSFVNTTTETITSTFEAFLDQQDEFGIDRSTYLNSNSTGTVLLNIEHPYSLVNTDEIEQIDLVNFAVGIMNRILAIKSLLPNIKVGVLGLGQPHPLGDESSLFSSYQSILSMTPHPDDSSIKIIELVDLITPVLYQVQERGTEEWNKIYRGERSIHMKTISDILQSSGNNKPIKPVMAFEYQSGPHDGDDASVLNRNEMLLCDSKDFIFVENSPSEFDTATGKRIDLLNTIYDSVSGSNGIMMLDQVFHRDNKYKSNLVEENPFKEWPGGSVLQQVYQKRRMDIWSDNRIGFLFGGNEIDSTVSLDGTTIDFNSDASKSLLMSLSEGDYRAYIDEYVQNVFSYINKNLILSKFKRAKEPQNILCLDIQHKLFDMMFSSEVGGWGIRNGVTARDIDNEVPHDNGTYQPIEMFFDLDDPTKPFGSCSPNFRFYIIQDALVRISNMMRGMVGHNRVTIYNAPFNIVPEDILNLIDPSKNNLGETELQNAFNYAWNSRDLKPLTDAVGYSFHGWQPSPPAHKKNLFDSLVTTYANVVGERGILLCGTYYNAYDAGTNLIDFTQDGWSGLDLSYRGTGEYTTAGNDVGVGFYPINGGVIKYIAEQINDKGVLGVILPEFDISNAITNKLDLNQADVMNNSLGPAQGHIYTVDQTDTDTHRKNKKMFYQWYFGNQLGGLIESPLPLNIIANETHFFKPDRRPMFIHYWAANGSRDVWKLNSQNVATNTPPAWLTNPNATSAEQDYIWWWKENIGEKLYELGARRITVRDPNGDTPGLNQRGFGIPASNWTTGESFAGHKFNDADNYFDDTAYEPPFYDTILTPDEPDRVNGTLQDRSESWKKYIKPWLLEKQALGDPIDFRIYDGYQVVMFGEENGTLDRDPESKIAVPASGNLALRIFDQDDVWLDGNNPRFDLLQPIPDFTNLDHVSMKESEAISWRDLIGVNGMVVDKASGAASTSRPSGFFDFYYDRGMGVMGEAVPMAWGTAPGPPANPDLITAAPYMAQYLKPGAVSGNFWGAEANDTTDGSRRWEYQNFDESNTEVHCVGLWGYNGSGNGFNVPYKIPGTGGTGEPPAEYDMVALKNHIDEIMDRGFVFSTGLIPFVGALEPEKRNREEIIRYICSTQGQGGRKDIPADLSAIPYENPQSVSHERISSLQYNDDLRINSMIAGDGRGLLGAPGAQNGPAASNFIDITPDNRYTTPVIPSTVEEHARQCALGVIARIITKGNPEKPCLFLYGIGSNTMPECAYFDEKSFEEGSGQVGGDLNQWFKDNSVEISRSRTYTQVRSDYDDDPNAYRASPVGPRLYFHEDDALETHYEFAGGVSHQVYEPISYDSWQNGGENLAEDLGIDVGELKTKYPITPYRAWTPWMSNGIEHMKRWVDSFCKTYKEEQAYWSDSGITIADPHRFMINTDPGFSPQIYAQSPFVDFALMKKDPRFSTEVIPGWGRTLQQMQDATPYAALNIAPEATAADGVGQEISCGTWDWVGNSNGGKVGEIFTSNFTSPDGRPVPFPQKTGDGKWWPRSDANPWWLPNRGQAPSTFGRRRYDLITFENWLHGILHVAKQGAAQEGLFKPFRSHFPHVGCTDYNDTTSSDPVPRDSVKKWGTNRSEDDGAVYDYNLFVDDIATPMMYKPPYAEWQDKDGNSYPDEFERRLFYWSETIDRILNSDMNQTLIGTSISPYDPEGSFRFTPSGRNIIPWVHTPTANPTSENPPETNETFAEFVTMLSEKGIKEIITWIGPFTPAGEIHALPQVPLSTGGRNVFGGMEEFINPTDGPDPGQDDGPDPGGGGGGGGGGPGSTPGGPRP